MKPKEEITFRTKINELIPKYADIPAEFKHSNNKWQDLVAQWFYNGLKSSVLVAKEGIDRKKALNHVGTILQDWGPSHEHKFAACAYLLSLWFEEV